MIRLFESHPSIVIFGKSGHFFTKDLCGKSLVTKLVSINHEQMSHCQSCTRSGGVSPTHLRGPVRPSFGVPGDIKGKGVIWLGMLYGWLWRVKFRLGLQKADIW